MQEGEDSGGKVAGSREMSPLGGGMSIESGSPGGVRAPRPPPGTHPLARRGSHSRACGSTAVHRAVWGRERSSMSPGAGGWGKASPQDTSPWLGTSPTLLIPCGHLHPSTPRAPSPAAGAAPASPAPPSCKGRGCPNGTARHSTAQPCPAGIPHACCPGALGQGHPHLGVAPRGQRLAAALAA